MNYGSGGYGSAVKDAVVEHPVSAAMIGMGLAWLVAGRGSLRGPLHRPASGPRTYFKEVRDTVSYLMNEQPLLLGAMGLAIGAGVAASLPSTHAENDAFGGASAAFQEKAGQVAREQMENASEVAENVASAVSDEIKEQGLTPRAVQFSEL